MNVMNVTKENNKVVKVTIKIRTISLALIIISVAMMIIVKKLVIMTIAIVKISVVIIPITKTTTTTIMIIITDRIVMITIVVNNNINLYQSSSTGTRSLALALAFTVLLPAVTNTILVGNVIIIVPIITIRKGHCTVGHQKEEGFLIVADYSEASSDMTKRIKLTAPSAPFIVQNQKKMLKTELRTIL